MSANVAKIATAATLAALLTSSGCAPARGEAYATNLAGARRAYHAGRFEEAAASYAEAAKTARQPRDAVYARYEAALALERAGEIARSAAELRSIARATPPSPYAPMAALHLALMESEEDGARAAALEDVALRFGDNGVARVAIVRLLSRDDDAGPEAALARADRLCPRLTGKAAAETCAYERAKRLAAHGRSRDALEAFLALAERWPYPFGSYFDDALFHASEIEEQSGRFSEAIALLERLLEHREVATFMGSYERPKYVPAVLRLADIYEHRLHDRARAREALHRLARDFPSSTLRDDALYREAKLWQQDGKGDVACDRLASLVHDFPDSRYVPCAIARCATLRRPAASKAPTTCHAYLDRPASGTP